MDIVLPDNWIEWTATEFLGEGSYGQVYKAENADGQVCAIKVIEIPKTKEEEDSIRREYGDEETVKSFYTNLAEEYEREIRLLDSLKDAQNIVRIYDYCKEPSGVGWKLFIRMEYLQSFAEYCDVNEITEERIAEFAIDICNALIQCEQLGIIHRDLKPDNILVDAQGKLKLCDFGLARTMDASRGSYSVKGTFTYMAPEVFLGRKYSNQVDIYSLGIILYRLLNKGRDPFVPLDKKLVYYKDKESALSRRMDGEKFPDPADASPEMGAIVQRACAYHPEDRYLSAADMMADLKKLQKGSFRKRLMTNTQKRRLLIAVAVVILAAAGGTGYVWTQVLNGVHASLSSDGVLEVYGNKPVTNKTVSAYQDDAKALVIRDGIPEIEDGCFGSFEKVETVQIPDSVTEIGAGAFANCTSLSELDLTGSGVKEIGGAAFEGCTSLTRIRLPDTLPVIEASLMNECSRLKEVDFGNSRPALIDENAFHGCSALGTMQIPDSVETVGTSAFEDCEKLETVQLGKETKTLSDTAFNGCGALKEVDGIEHITTFGGDVFTGTEWEKETADPDGFLTVNGVLLRYLGTAESVRIPDGADTVGNSAFADANTVRTVTVGKNVKRIDALAFAYSMISEFIFEDPDSIETIGEGAFSETPWLQSQMNESKTVKIGDLTIKGDE